MTIPTVIGKKVSGNLVKAKCCYCKGYHLHRIIEEDRPQHKLSDCEGGGSYYIVLEDEVWQQSKMNSIPPIKLPTV